MLPKTGKRLPSSEENVAFAALMADALADELGRTHQAVKIAMRWTGASERCVKHWLAGTHAPCGSHLVGLMRHSDKVLERILSAAGRQDSLLAVDVMRLRGSLVDLLSAIDGHAFDQNHLQPGR
jgi:hypothetical protein